MKNTILFTLFIILIATIAGCASESDAESTINDKVICIMEADQQTVNQGESITFNVLENDDCINATPILTAVSDLPEVGTVEFSPDGIITFTPNEEAEGKILLNYNISAGERIYSAQIEIEIKKENHSEVCVEDDKPDMEGIEGSRIIRVGPDRTYRQLSYLEEDLQDGDTVLVKGGEYICDSITIRRNDITIKGICGQPIIDRTTCTTPKGIITQEIGAKNLTIDNFELTGAKSVSENGAGIRIQGYGEILIKNIYAHHNENGILQAPPSVGFVPQVDLHPHGSTEAREAYIQQLNLTVEHSEFAFNGHCTSKDPDNPCEIGKTHNLYIGECNRFNFFGNYSHSVQGQGHLLKSRARISDIRYNLLLDGKQGISSRHIDVPNGGIAYIVGNILQQSENSPNHAMIGYSNETNDGTNIRSGKELYLVNNTFVNNKEKGYFLNVDERGYLLNDTTIDDVYIINNIFAGYTSNNKIIQITSSDGITLSSTNYLSMSSNLMMQNPGFKDAQNDDYSLSAGSDAINAGTTPPTEANPTEQYLHPIETESRRNSDTIDIGAFEF